MEKSSIVHHVFGPAEGSGLWPRRSGDQERQLKRAVCDDPLLITRKNIFWTSGGWEGSVSSVDAAILGSSGGGCAVLFFNKHGCAGRKGRAAKGMGRW